MNRRNFMKRVMGTGAGLSLAGAGAAAAHKLTAVSPVENRIVHFKVNGFSCATCATGLEVTLRGLNGVARAHAEYPEGTVVIGFDQNVISDSMLRAAITDCGFSLT
jgi:copper chaperone CopZ